MKRARSKAQSSKRSREEPNEVEIEPEDFSSVVVACESREDVLELISTMEYESSQTRVANSSSLKEPSASNMASPQAPCSQCLRTFKRQRDPGPCATCSKARKTTQRWPEKSVISAIESLNTKLENYSKELESGLGSGSSRATPVAVTTPKLPNVDMFGLYEVPGEFSSPKKNGVGFGGGEYDDASRISRGNMLSSLQQSLDKASSKILRYLSGVIDSPAFVLTRRIASGLSKVVVSALTEWLRESWIDLCGRRKVLLEAILLFLESTIKHKSLVPLLCAPVGTDSTSMIATLRTLAIQATLGDDKLGHRVREIAASIESEWAEWKNAPEAVRGRHARCRGTAKRKAVCPTQEAQADPYIEALKHCQLVSCGGIAAVHKYAKSSLPASAAAAVRRIHNELGCLATSLPLHPESSIFVAYDDRRTDLLRALITGPADTPYENGCFVFDIRVPSNYPRSPPNVSLLTTGKGTVRFNPNLYSDGHVCLSLLGTWSGPGWSPTSTLLQVLLSIQSLIFVSEPYFNEPGYDSFAGTPGGQRASEQYNHVVRKECLKWAMLEKMKDPPLGFEEVIRQHFKHRSEAILAQLEKWNNIPNDPFKEEVARLTVELRQRLDIKPASTSTNGINVEECSTAEPSVTLRRSERLRKKAKL
ncbi:ubiquitin-conjugating enzyme E2 Ze [Perkinsus chesapeaki]|uniref:Ubiquitin-conjugating enzyme E2 Ze n=1 Tax=Perkinsus chesapeaki TaxID=330153 RepID=A0A7J6N3Y3_PERCH|nr:ubiquitin-conjugating enzyme E2 Ze [Perkinsus chesapeaki]